MRQRKDDERLLDLISRRLTVAEDPDEIAKLFWERARVLRGKGDREGALTALENVRMLEPDHVGALALSGEIFITVGRFEEAASHLAELAAHPQAPTQQRLMSGVAAVPICSKNKLQDPVRALAVLTALHRRQAFHVARARAFGEGRHQSRRVRSSCFGARAADERAATIVTGRIQAAHAWPWPSIATS